MGPVEYPAPRTRERRFFRRDDFLVWRAILLGWKL